MSDIKLKYNFFGSDWVLSKIKDKYYFKYIDNNKLITLKASSASSMEKKIKACINKFSLNPPKRKH